jgi:ABC-type polysaccharide/polyol phosphate export permease
MDSNPPVTTPTAVPSAPTQRHFLWLHAGMLIRLRFRGACLGLAWNILQPALYLVLFGFVFAALNRASYREYVVYLFAGLVPWRFFEQACHAMTTSVAASEVITRGFRVPYYYFPASELCAQFVDFLASFLVLLALLALFRMPLHATVAVLPLSILLWALIAGGAGLCLSVLFVFLRDIRPLVQMMLLLALFSSTVFFKPETMGGQTRAWWLLLNPVCYWAALFQRPLYYGTWPQPLDWLVSLGSGFALLALGIGLYAALRRKFYYYF